MPAPGDQYHSANIQNPFEERRVNAFTAQEIATLQSRLNRQLGPEYISHRQGAGGTKVAYLEGTKAIALANDVFGFNGWSSSLQQVQVDEHQNGRINLGLSIIVRVTLRDGTYHEDIGYGQIENAKGKGAAFEKAKKEAATDGLKRALRNFGNVLGNCLYDKEYLKKVRTMKAEPIKFREDRLHRHPDFARPIKAEKWEGVKIEGKTTAGADQMGRINTDQLVEDQSTLSISPEFDDEFGGNLFDGVEISEHHGDEFTFETAPTYDEAAPKKIQAPTPVGAANAVVNTGGAPVMNGPRQHMNRVQSVPAIRPQEVVHQVPQQQHAQNQPPSRPAAPNLRGQHIPNGQQNNAHADTGKRIPPTVDIHAPAKSTVPSLPPNQPQRNTSPQVPQADQAASRPSSVPVPNPSPGHRASVGFVTSRAATLIQNPESAVSLNNVPAFNPHAESPLPKEQRTPGIDHTRSMKITRESIGVPVVPPPSQSPAPPQGQQGGQFRPVGPSNRTNFVNPQQDANRRIGMPGAHAMSPLANRSGYKPPGLAGGVKRPPLADVSNQNGNAEGPEAKKPRLEPQGVENNSAVES